jgi:uncharacterized membrane protein
MRKPMKITEEDKANGVITLAGISAVGIGIVTKNVGWGFLGFVISLFLISFLYTILTWMEGPE